MCFKLIDNDNNGEMNYELQYSPIFQAVYVIRFFFYFSLVVAIPFLIFNFSNSIVPFVRLLILCGLAEVIYRFLIKVR